MNIQIFVKSKSFDCKKAERFFKERNIKYQRIDLEDKGMSKGEYASVKAAVGGDFQKLIDKKCKLYDKLFIAHLAYPSQIEEKLLENGGLFAAPIVRNGKAVTVGVDERTWNKWIEEDKKGE